MSRLVQKRIEPVVPQTTEQGWYIDKSRFDFHIDPVLNQSVGGPENFYMYQFGGDGDRRFVDDRPPANHR